MQAFGSGSGHAMFHILFVGGLAIEFMSASAQKRGEELDLNIGPYWLGVCNKPRLINIRMFKFIKHVAWALCFVWHRCTGGFAETQRLTLHVKARSGGVPSILSSAEG